MKKSRGQSTVEFALVLPIFAMVFFAIVEFGHLFYVNLTLRQAIGQAGRFMITGRTTKDSGGSDIPREQAIKDAFDKWLIGTGVGLQSFQMTCNGVPCTGGISEETVLLTATFNKPLFTVLFANFFPGGGGCPAGNLCFTLSTTWKNEPFSSST